MLLGRRYLKGLSHCLQYGEGSAKDKEVREHKQPANNIFEKKEWHLEES